MSQCRDSGWLWEAKADLVPYSDAVLPVKINELNRFIFLRNKVLLFAIPSVGMGVYPLPFPTSSPRVF
jgi:hypothetical protein